MRQNRERWKKMSPEQRERVRRNRERWKDMPTPQLDDAFRKQIIDSVEAMMEGQSIEELEKQRDERLLALLSIREKLTG